MSGYDVDMVYLAQKIGQLKAVSDAVLAAATSLECPSGDLGPGDINAAVRELASSWRDGIEEIGTRISEMSGHVSGALDNYQAVEDAARQSFANGMCPTVPAGMPAGTPAGTPAGMQP